MVFEKARSTCSSRIRAIAITKVHFQVHMSSVLACKVTRFTSDLLCKSWNEDHQCSVDTKGHRLRLHKQYETAIIHIGRELYRSSVRAYTIGRPQIPGGSWKIHANRSFPAFQLTSTAKRLANNNLSLPSSKQICT